MIQDIAPHQFHNEYKAYEIQNGDYVLFYRQRDVLLRYVMSRLFIRSMRRSATGKAEVTFICFQSMHSAIIFVMRQMRP